MSNADPVLAFWEFEATEPQVSRVLPDGCRDLILKVPAASPPRCFVSGLATQAYDVRSAPGERFHGFRLQPAARFDERSLLAATRRSARTLDADMLVTIREHVRVDARLDEALTALATACSVPRASALVGVSTRTLERLVHSSTSHPPVFWRALARARQTGRALVTCMELPLVEAASRHGYADQAHMTREFRRWFGLSPGRLRRDAGVVATITQVGYD